MKPKHQSGKPSKLASFGAIGKGGPAKLDADAGERPHVGGRGRTNPDKAIVAQSVRLAREDWIRCRELAFREGKSFNQLITELLSQHFEAQGLPGLSGVGR